MSVDAQTDLQVAILSALENNAPLMNAITGIYDFVDQESIYPYVTIGNDNYIWFGTMGEDGGQYDIQIDVWSQYEGRKECKDIMKLIANALHNQPLTIINNVHISTRISFQETIKEADRITHHGVQRYTIYLHEA